MYGRSTYHSVVLKLRLAERRGVASNDDELGLAVAERLEGALVAEGDFARLHDQSQTAVDRVGIALSFLGCDLLAASHEAYRRISYGPSLRLGSWC